MTANQWRGVENWYSRIFPTDSFTTSTFKMVAHGTKMFAFQLSVFLIIDFTIKLLVLNNKIPFLLAASPFFLQF